MRCEISHLISHVSLLMSIFSRYDPHMKKWFVYIVRCADKSLYTGISTDVDRRIMQHNTKKGAAYTRSRGPISIVFKQGPLTESKARKREAEIKKWTKEKKELFVASASKKKLGRHRLKMKKSKMVKLDLYKPMKELVLKSDHKILGVWAADCAERVLPYFEKAVPKDHRPRKAIKALRTWVKTSVFKMADIRGGSLAAHAAARSVEHNDVARSAARAAGQALATAHVPTHSLAAAMYAATVIRDVTDSDDAVIKERDWQYRHLVDLRKTG